MQTNSAEKLSWMDGLTDRLEVQQTDKVFYRDAEWIYCHQIFKGSKW